MTRPQVVEHPELQRIVASEGLTEGHSADALAEATRWSDAPGFEDGTEDLLDVPFVTIDGPDSRDLDQAVHVERSESGYRVRYAVADASYYVRPGSALFREALARGATYYVAGRSFPMLPVSLSEGLISLNPGQVRRAVVFDLSVSYDGLVRSREVLRARIRSRAKLSFPEVQAFHDADEAGQGLVGKEYTGSLHQLREVGQALLQRNTDGDRLVFQRAEPQVRVDTAEGRSRLDVRRRERLAVEDWNAEISVLCNHVGAELIQENADNPEVESIFRVHAPPMSEMLSSLRETIDEICDQHAVEPEWRWPGASEQSLSSYLRYLHGQNDFPSLRRALERQVMYANQASRFRKEVGQHYALGIDAYARLTAPMREIVGIYSHHELLQAAGLETQGDWDVEGLRDQVIDAAERSRRRQKQLSKKVEFVAIKELLSSDANMATALRPRRQGSVVAVRRSRAYVHLDGFAVEIKLYRDDLEHRYRTEYELDGQALVPTEGSSAPSLRVGDPVSLQVLAFDRERDRFSFTVTVSSASGNARLYGV